MDQIYIAKRSLIRRSNNLSKRYGRANVEKMELNALMDLINEVEKRHTIDIPKKVEIKRENSKPLRGVQLYLL